MLPHARCRRRQADRRADHRRRIEPFLGTRGIRLSLARPEVFRVQLRALARAAAHGDVKVMLPMVTVPTRSPPRGACFDEAAAELGAGRRARPPLGIMVEVPAAASRPSCSTPRFFSIGSNDLTNT